MLSRSQSSYGEAWCPAGKTPHPRPKEARKEPSRGPIRTMGSAKQVRVCQVQVEAVDTN